jgi:hypothetical protein
MRAQLQYRAPNIDASVASRDLVWRCPRDLGVSQMRRCSRTLSNESGCHALRGRNRPTQSDHRVMRSSWVPCEVCSITPPGRATSIPLSAPSRKGQNQRTTVFRRSILSEGVSRHASVYAQPCAPWIRLDVRHNSLMESRARSGLPRRAAPSGSRFGVRAAGTCAGIPMLVARVNSQCAAARHARLD